LHPPIAARQGLHIGRSPRPDALSRIPLDQLLACTHRRTELRQESCPTCSAGTRIMIFACDIHRKCQLDDKIQGVEFCGTCADRTPFNGRAGSNQWVTGASPLASRTISDNALKSSAIKSPVLELHLRSQIP
jgi:hypothetical protein